MVILGILPPTRLHADTAYAEDFSSGNASASWLGSNLTVSQATGTNTSRFLGKLNNDTVTLPLNGLDVAGGNAMPNQQGSHSFVTISYDLFIIGGWTGNNGGRNLPPPHTFAFETDDSENGLNHRLTTTFSNRPGLYQTFPYDSQSGNFFSQPGGKRANELNTLGFSAAASGYNDAVYRLAGGRNHSFTFDHTVGDLTLTFSAADLPPAATWGITNLKAVTGGVFSWQAAPSVGDGLDGGWDVGEHWANPDPTMVNSPGPDDAAEFPAAGSYDVSIHQNYSSGFFRFNASEANASSVLFNTIGHTLTLTAGDFNNASLAVADNSNENAYLFIINSNNDVDSNFDGVINAETLGIGRGDNDQGTLTLDGHLDPAAPGTNGNPLGNVILNVQREMTVGDGASGSSAILTIQQGAILNGGIGGGSASSDPGDGNADGVYAYVDGTVHVASQAIWNQSGIIWTGVAGQGSVDVSGGGKVNIFQFPYAGQTSTIGGTLLIGGFSGASGAFSVEDLGSQLNAGEMRIGSAGSAGSLAIDNSAIVTAASASVGSDISGSPGIPGNSLVNVTHEGFFSVTTPSGDGQLMVGDHQDGRVNLGDVSGNNSSLFSTGQVTTDFAVIGNSAEAHGEMNVSYAQAANLHSLFTVNQTLTVGGAGNGTLGMGGGGVTVIAGVDVGGGPLAIAGDQAGSHGLITMYGGAGTTNWSQASTFDASAGGMVIGNSGFGRLEVYDNAQAFAKTIVMAQQTGATAELVIDGDGADDNHTTFLKVSDTGIGLALGKAGTSATATVVNGSLLDTFRSNVGGQGGNAGLCTVTVKDLRDPGNVLRHVLGSLWLVHGQSLGSSSVGGTLDIGGDGINGQTGGSGNVSIGSAGRLGVEIGMRLGRNGRLDLTGGAATVGTANPLQMDFTANRLHVVGNTSLPAATASVSGQGVIVGDVLIDSGGNLGPNGLVTGGTGALSISGSLHVRSGGHLATTVNGTGTGNYDTFKLLNGSLTLPAGTATLDNGAGITITGGGSYHTPQSGDYVDVLTAAKVVIGALDLTLVGLPSTDWHYGVVSVAGGQALRIQYGTAVHDAGSVSIQGSIFNNGLPAANLLVDAEPGISALTDVSGHYVLSVASGSSGTFAPISSGFVFGPPGRSFTNLTTDLSGQDFLMNDSILPRIVVTSEGTLRRVTWTGLTGISYQAETSTNLLNWTPFGSPIAGSNVSVSFTYPTTSDPKRFFRVRSNN